MRLPNSKNLPENMNMAMCSSGNALPMGDSRASANLSLSLVQADSG